MLASRKPDFNVADPDRRRFAAAMRGEPATGNLVARSKATAADTGKLAAALCGSRRLDPATALRLAGSRRLDEAIARAAGLRIVPSAAGRIERLLLCVPTKTDNGRLVVSGLHKRHLRALAAALGARRDYLIVCHPAFTEEIHSWFAGIAGVSIEFVLSPRFAFSVWARDASVALNAPFGDQVLLESVLFPRYEDMAVADDIAAQTEVCVLQSGLYFQGGNVLGGPEITLVGQDEIWRNTTRFGLETADKVIAAFERAFGTRIVALGHENTDAYDWYKAGILWGYGHQPQSHIDMYVTRTGAIGKTGREIVMLGRPGMAKKVVGHYSEVPELDNPTIDGFFDATEHELWKHFEVRHLPTLLTRNALAGYAPYAEYYYLTFNNVLVETGTHGPGTRGTVVMTTYAEDSQAFGTDAGLRRELEDASEAIWREAGFDVRRLDGMEDLAWGTGSIHYITQSLKRGPPLKRPRRCT